jgi:hypothetical protein
VEVQVRRLLSTGSGCHPWTRSDHCWLVALCIAALAQVAAAGNDQATVTVDIRACASAEVELIFGKSVEACVIYDVQKHDAVLEIKFCSGLKIGGGAKAVIGASVDASVAFCTTARIPLNRSDTPENLLKDPEIQKQLKQSLGGTLGNKLQGLDDDVLSKLGVKREDLGKLSVDRLGAFVNRSGEGTVKDTVNGLKKAGR